uniref:Uncharacterized protein n=1 Tax=Arion vulgaris TaxID=1028688 RepID=A0A0B6ZEJ0_9EUPU
MLIHISYSLAAGVRHWVFFVASSLDAIVVAVAACVATSAVEDADRKHQMMVNMPTYMRKSAVLQMNQSQHNL